MESRPACAFCAGRRGLDRLTRLGIEPSALEQETPHEPNCPLLLRRPMRWWAKALMLSIIPTAAMAPGCPSAVRTHYIPGGLDDGTISTLCDPDTDAGVTTLH